MGGGEDQTEEEVRSIFLKPRCGLESEFGVLWFEGVGIRVQGEGLGLRSQESLEFFWGIWARNLQLEALDRKATEAYSCCRYSDYASQ